MFGVKEAKAAYHLHSDRDAVYVAHAMNMLLLIATGFSVKYRPECDAKSALLTIPGYDLEYECVSAYLEWWRRENRESIKVA